jgi:hypothetical protein
MTDRRNNNDSATKRVRIDDSATDTDNQLHPLEKVEQFIRRSVATLHTDLQIILVQIGKEFILAYSKVHNLEIRNKNFLDDESRIPQSAKIKFAYAKPKEIEQRPDFQALKNETDEAIRNYHQTMRQFIIRANAIDSNHATERLQETLAIGVRQFISAMLECTFNPNVPDIDAATRYFIEKENFDLFSKIRDDNMNCARLAPIYSRATNHTLATQNESIQLNTQLDPHLESFNRIAKCLFVSSAEEYVKALNESQVTARLRELNKEFKIRTATRPVAMDIDTEPAASTQTIEALVKTAVAAALKKDRSASKNKDRGATIPKAKGKRNKKNGAPTNQRNSSAAAESDNASSREPNERNNQPSGNSQSNRRSGRSKKRTAKTTRQP